MFHRYLFAVVTLILIGIFPAAEVSAQQASPDDAEDFSDHVTLAEMEAYLDAVAAAHPDIVAPKIVIGQSIEGRDIWAIKISDNPEIDEDEPEVLFHSGESSRSGVGLAVIMGVIDTLTENYAIDPVIQSLVNESEIWFVPLMNPDGFYYNEVDLPEGETRWSKNRRDNGDGTIGVNLGRNWGYNWGYDDDGSSGDTEHPSYRGTGPFSEPETAALSNFELAHEFIISCYFGFYGERTYYPWGYNRRPTDDYKIFLALADSVQALTGYYHSRHQIYPSNGTCYDWEYGEQTLKNKTYGLNVEVGKTYSPDQELLNEFISLQQPVAMFFLRVADHVELLKPPLAPQVTVPESVEGTELEVTWTHDDPYNPAVAYELAELRGGDIIVDQANGFDSWNMQNFELSTYNTSSAPTSFHAINFSEEMCYLETRYPYLVGPADVLTFSTLWSFGHEYHYAEVEIYDLDGGAPETEYGNLPTYYDKLKGTSVVVVDAEIDLSDYVGKQIILRFNVMVNHKLAIYYPGFFVDDIALHRTFSTETILASGYGGTSYSFVEKPAGEYSYRVRARDAEGQWSDWSPIATTVMISDLCCVDPVGDANNDGNPEPTIGDISLLIDALFIAENPALLSCLEEADVNQSGGADPAPGDITIGDISYLIDYLFVTGQSLGLYDCP